MNVIGLETYMNNPSMCRYQSKTRVSTHLKYGSRMLWSYFGLGHGKGVHDGVGAILKLEIRKEQFRMDGQKLQNVVDVVAFCEHKQLKEHAAYPNA